MARINNGSVQKRIIDDLKVNLQTDKVPVETSDKVILNYSLNSRAANQIVSGSTAGTSSTTLHTASDVKKTYLVAFELGFIKDATCNVTTNTTCKLVATIGGDNKTIMSFPLLTTTLQQGYKSLSLPEPMLIDKSGIVSMAANPFTVGSFVKSCTVYLRVED